MALTERLKELRRGRITASRAAGALGFSRYQSKGDVFCQVLYDVETPGSAATEAGDLFEPMLRGYAAKQLGCPVEFDEDQAFRKDQEHDFLSATLDGWVAGRPGEIVQCKTFATTHIPTREELAEWGPEGTDQIPQEYVLQCQHELYVARAQINWVPVYIGCSGFRMYRIERNEALIGRMVNNLCDFYRNHIEPRIPPPDSLPCLEILRALPRQPNKVVPIAYDLVEAWQTSRAARLEAEKSEESNLQALLSALGDAEAGDCPQGQFRYMAESAGRRLDTERIKAEQSAIYDQYAIHGTRRVPRFKVNKGR